MLSPLLDKDHPAALQALEVVRYHGLLKARGIADFGHILGSMAQQIDDPQPVRIRQRAEKELVRFVLVLHHMKKISCDI